MAKVVVDVMLKPEILDPQGQAIANAAARLGYSSIDGVRQGKRFEIDIAGEVDEAVLESVRAVATQLLTNPVMETYEMRVV